MEKFEPKILAFLCNWCAYAAADLAGVSRFQYPPNVKPLRVMCSARVDPVFIIKALKAGWDGILVSGWHFGDCHYLDGNVQAEKKIRLTQELLDLATIGKNRLHLAWCSSAEGQRFAEIVSEVTESIRSQGDFDPKTFSLELDAAEMTAKSETLRWLVGKEVSLTTKGDVYGRKWEANQFKKILSAALEREYQKNLICIALKEGSTSVRDISERTGIENKKISYLISDLEKNNQVIFKGHSEGIPEFESTVLAMS
jgi:F420-non-reducing hydrogenase iron-sulfur subunit